MQDPSLSPVEFPCPPCELLPSKKIDDIQSEAAHVFVDVLPILNQNSMASSRISLRFLSEQYNAH
jgi:hypothetical protein